MFALLSVICRSMSIITENDAIAELALLIFCFGCLLQSGSIKDSVGNKATGHGMSGTIC